MEWELVIQVVAAAAGVAVMLSAACDAFQREDDGLQARKAEWEQLLEQRKWEKAGQLRMTHRSAGPEDFTQQVYQALSRKTTSAAPTENTDSSGGSNGDAPSQN